MSKDKYRIKIETINGNDEELRAEYRMGLDCEGFAIIGDREGRTDLSLHKMSTLDIAHAIAVSDELMQAAYIAIGLDNAKQSHERRPHEGRGAEDRPGRHRPRLRKGWRG